MREQIAPLNEGALILPLRNHAAATLNREVILRAAYAISCAKRIGAKAGRRLTEPAEAPFVFSIRRRGRAFTTIALRPGCGAL